ncbi:MAG TPA: cache domain-containing protein [Desulfuromonadaceae bacterium]
MCLLILLLALPTIGVILHSGIRERREAVTASYEEVEKLAHVMASEIQLLVDSTRQLSLTLSRLPDVQSRNAASLNPLLKELVLHYPYYTTIFITDRNGVVWASSLPASHRHSVADRRYFTAAIATGQFSAGEFAIGKASGLPTVGFAYPLKDRNGSVTGVIGVSLNLRATTHLHAQKKLPADVTYAIFDHRGTILFRSTDADRFVGTPDRPELFSRMRTGTDLGIFIARTNDRQYRRLAYRKLRLSSEQSPYMYVRAGIPVASATKAANSALLDNLALFAPFLVAALGLGWFVNKRCVVDRVLTLQSASRRLAAGDLTTRVATRVSGGELGELAHTFDSMASALQTHERELREKSELLNAVIEGTPDAIFVKDRDGRYLLFSSGAVAMTGTSAAEIIGKDDTHLFPPDVARMVREKDRAIMADGSVLVCEEVVVDGSGNPRVVFATKGPIRDAEGIVTGMFGIARDITERRQAEAALQDAHDELERRVKARTAELAALVKTLRKQVAERKRAESALKAETAQRLQALEQLRENERIMIQQNRQVAMGEMISNIAHQWRQPLNTLGMVIQRLQLFHDLGEFSPEFLRVSTMKAMLQIKQMSATIEEFSTFFRPDQAMVTFKVNEAIKRAVSLVEANFQQHGIALTMEGEGDPQIIGYPSEYSQALLNILLNARDAFGERAVEAARITVRSFIKDGAAVVAIADNAGGIPEEIMDKIFDPHFTTKGPQSSGIGLFMAKSIIERSMNGRLTACNVQRGAEFRVEI